MPSQPELQAGPASGPETPLWGRVLAPSSIRPLSRVDAPACPGGPGGGS